MTQQNLTAPIVKWYTFANICH